MVGWFLSMPIVFCDVSSCATWSCRVRGEVKMRVGLERRMKEEMSKRGDEEGGEEEASIFY